ncbi:MAG: winged helix DNA-binding protein [Dehalococcoidales bacterium]|jgi:DNA-binding MarR family transcriptional regulator|nr:winged helix DNA-binding protein [Dehalococcoidales bacterium]
MEESLPLDKQYRLWLLLSQTRSAIFRARQKKVGSYLHPNQATALCTVWALNGQATPAMLSRMLFLERHTVSELISRMEEKGLVKKTRDPLKKNVVRISITEKGRKVGHDVIQLDFIRKIMSSLTEEQQEKLHEYLSILLKAAVKELGTEEELSNLK